MNFRSRLALCWRVLRAKPNNFTEHAERELRHIGSDPMGLEMAKSLRELVWVFSTHEHSGFSAAYACGAAEKLFRFKPLAPLKGDDGEWNQVGPTTWQNNRLSRVFKDSERFDGKPYDIEAVVFREANGACFTGRGSHQVITFPYMPRTVYVDVDTQGNPLDGWNREGVCPAWVSA